VKVDQVVFLQADGAPDTAETGDGVLRGQIDRAHQAAVQLLDAVPVRQVNLARSADDADGQPAMRI